MQSIYQVFVENSRRDEQRLHPYALSDRPNTHTHTYTHIHIHTHHTHTLSTVPPRSHVVVVSVSLYSDGLGSFWRLLWLSTNLNSMELLSLQPESKTAMNRLSGFRIAMLLIVSSFGWCTPYTRQVIRLFVANTLIIGYHWYISRTDYPHHTSI